MYIIHRPNIQQLNQINSCCCFLTLTLHKECDLNLTGIDRETTSILETLHYITFIIYGCLVTNLL